MMRVGYKSRYLKSSLKSSLLSNSAETDGGHPDLRKRLPPFLPLISIDEEGNHKNFFLPQRKSSCSSRY